MNVEQNWTQTELVATPAAESTVNSITESQNSSAAAQSLSFLTCQVVQAWFEEDSLLLKTVDGRVLTIEQVHPTMVNAEPVEIAAEDSACAEAAGEETPQTDVTVADFSKKNGRLEEMFHQTKMDLPDFEYLYSLNGELGPEAMPLSGGSFAAGTLLGVAASAGAYYAYEEGQDDEEDEDEPVNDRDNAPDAALIETLEKILAGPASATPEDWQDLGINVEFTQGDLTSINNALREYVSLGTDHPLELDRVLWIARMVLEARIGHHRTDSAQTSSVEYVFSEEGLDKLLVGANGEITFKISETHDDFRPEYMERPRSAGSIAIYGFSTVRDGDELYEYFSDGESNVHYDLDGDHITDIIVEHREKQNGRGSTSETKQSLFVVDGYYDFSETEQLWDYAGLEDGARSDNVYKELTLTRGSTVSVNAAQMTGLYPIDLDMASSMDYFRADGDDNSERYYHRILSDDSGTSQGMVIVDGFGIIGSGLFSNPVLDSYYTAALRDLTDANGYDGQLIFEHGVYIEQGIVVTPFSELDGSENSNAFSVDGHTGEGADSFLDVFGIRDIAIGVDADIEVQAL